jgi:hypothetical protein
MLIIHDNWLKFLEWGEDNGIKVFIDFDEESTLRLCFEDPIFGGHVISTMTLDEFVDCESEDWTQLIEHLPGMHPDIQKARYAYLDNEEIKKILLKLSSLSSDALQTIKQKIKEMEDGKSQSSKD